MVPRLLVFEFIRVYKEFSLESKILGVNPRLLKKFPRSGMFSHGTRYVSSHVNVFGIADECLLKHKYFPYSFPKYEQQIFH